ncbi:Alpha/beta hydrolase [Pararobbsia alpina]|uniref:alpha/beta fold hydrolase n=1 Tax=Pararobbsia alpina TaxID=621374 RepID=UPI0039A66BBC
MSERTFTTRDGCRLAYVDEGEGMPVLWQHGLGADRQQPAEVFPEADGIRRITLECRGHGVSELGDVNALSIAQFADDALELLDHLKISRAVIGGISLGAAIALRLAALHAERVVALVLARPAWTEKDAPESLQIYREVASLLDEYGPAKGASVFERSARLRAVERVSPDNAASMRGFFTRVTPESTIALLNRIPAQGPGIAEATIRQLDVAALVIANGEDYVHSIETANTLADWIPHGALRVITSKTVDRTRYVQEFRQALQDFFGAMRKTQSNEAQERTSVSPPEFSSASSVRNPV